MGKIPVLRFAVTKPRTSRYRPRTRVWGSLLLQQDETEVQQDELDALEALCCLSAGIHQPAARSTTPFKTKHQAKAGHIAVNRHKRRQQSAAKHVARQSPASEASSGATQVGLHALGLEAFGELPLPVEDIHPAALPPPIFARLQEITDKQHCAESSDTQHMLSSLTTLQSGDSGAQSQQQQSKGRQLVGIRPNENSQLQQQQQAHHLKLPLQQAPGAGVDLQQHDPDNAAMQTEKDLKASDCVAAGMASAALPSEAGQHSQALQQKQAWCPPVNRCFWHVYIARKIQEHQQTQVVLGSNQKTLSMDSPGKRQQHKHQNDRLQPPMNSMSTAHPCSLPPGCKKAKQQQQQEPQICAAPATAAAAALSKSRHAHPLATSTGGVECSVALEPVHAASRVPAGTAILQMAPPQTVLPGPQPPLNTHSVGMLPAFLAAAATCDTRTLHALSAAHRSAAAGVLPGSLCMAIGGPQHMNLPGVAGDPPRYGTLAPTVPQPPCMPAQVPGAHLLAQLLAADAFNCLAPSSLPVGGSALAPGWPYAHALGALVGAPLTFPGRVAV